MAIKSWDTKTSRMLYRRFEAGESLIEGLESLASRRNVLYRKPKPIKTS